MSNDPHVWCWTCDRNVGETGGYTHRDDDPVLRQRRCGTCNDHLMPNPRPADQPTGQERLEQRKLSNQPRYLAPWER